MFLYLIPFLLLWQTSEVPFRAREDYQVELKYSLKQRPAKDHNSVTFEQKNIEDRKPGSGPLPYLVVNVKVLNHKQEEIRFRCENNFGRAIFNRKAEKSLDYEIDMGYIDDLKDRVTPYAYTLYAVADNKESLNKIELMVMEDGTFMVNGEKRGKF
ncbi:MAG TPA: hypothetical protein VFE50_26235 [Cyclobacteriaceae bacterium]|nr:hypothetical protein [Cyclobacteriaceae bacterium]